LLLTSVKLGITLFRHKELQVDDSRRSAAPIFAEARTTTDSIHFCGLAMLDDTRDGSRRGTPSAKAESAEEQAMSTSILIYAVPQPLTPQNRYTSR